MRERPIPFNAPMVRALLAGTKTQTRRVVSTPRKRSSFVLLYHGKGWWPYESDDGESELCDDGMEHPYACPYGKPGDRLWVRETWRHTASDLNEARRITEDIMSGTAVDYAATYIANCMRELGFSRTEAEMAFDFEEWRHHRKMPRWASRILLEVTTVRVEQLHDISEADARAEGCIEEEKPGFPICSPRNWYRILWEQINGAGSWDANPWVWVVEFKRVTP